MHLLEALSVLDISKLITSLVMSKIHDKLCDCISAFQLFGKFTLKVILNVVFDFLLLLCHFNY